MTLDELRAAATGSRGAEAVWPAPLGKMSVTLETAEFLYALVRMMKVFTAYWLETAELPSGPAVASFGGPLNLYGSAYVYGCATRKISRYELRYAQVAAPGGEQAQPATDAPTPADWPVANQLHAPLIYDPSKYYPCTRVGEAPTNLINDWGTMHVGAPAPGGTD